MKTPYTSYKQQKGYVQNELQVLNNSSETGYGVALPKVSAENSSTWNAALLDNASRAFKMWVHEISMDFGLSGITGQSRHRRQFFPTSFNQTSVSVQGQMPNQMEYNKLAAFVRESHAIALRPNLATYQMSKNSQDKNQRRVSSTQPELLKLYINPYEPKKKGNALKQDGQSPTGAFKNKHKNIKGHHKQLIFEGYIKNITSGAERFNFVPQFKFDFIVAQAYLGNNNGIYDDTLDAGSQLMDWTTQLRTYGFGQQTFASSAPAQGGSKPSSSGNGPIVHPKTVTTGYSFSQISNKSSNSNFSSNPFNIFGPTR